MILLMGNESDSEDVRNRLENLRERAGSVSDSPGGDASDVNYVKETRKSSSSKQSTTREVNEFLSELESDIKQARKEVGSLKPARTQRTTSDGFDVVLHRSDDHFGDIVEDESGEVVFDSDMVEDRVRESFRSAIEAAKSKSGRVDTFHLLLGGDMVTNEKVYASQPFEIDATIDEQMRRATTVYFDEIKRLSEEFPFVQVVCQHGNHGGLQVKGSSSHANCDDMVYDQLEILCKEAGIDNVRFVKSDATNYVNFSIRGHNAHLRHGHNVNNHIGTSSPQSTWRNYVYQHDFDIAYRGHYHEHKIEYVSGKPVIMAPALKPSGDYEEQMGIFGEPLAYVHGVTDDSPLAWTEYLYYG